MSGTVGKSKDTAEKDGFRQFVINALGLDDQRKYFSLSGFGDDYNLPNDTRVLTFDSKNKDIKFIAGVLNKNWLNTLNKGERIVFSTSEDGETMESFIRFNNDGTMHQNGSDDNLAGFIKLKEGFDQAITDMNAMNAKLTEVIDAFTNWTPVPNDGGAALKALTAAIVAASDSAASIDDSKKDNLLTE